MIAVHEHQMKRISAQIETQFEQRLVRRFQDLNNHFKIPENNLKDDDTNVFVKDTLALGSSYDLELEGDFESFLTLQLGRKHLSKMNSAEKNDSLAWIESMLSREDMLAKLKIYLIIDQLREQSNEDKRAAYICDMLDFVN